MNTNIEPGCLCMVTDPDSFGTVVTALENIEGPVTICGDTGIPKTRVWKIDRLIEWERQGERGYMEPYCPEQLLRRIDTNPDEVTEKERGLYE